MIVARRLLLDRRRSLVWWSAGIVVMVLLTVALWPSIRGEDQFEDLVQDLPAAVRALMGAQEGIAFTSAPGYLHGRLFSTLLPVLLVVFGIGAGARAVGGSEDDGTMELLLAQPVTRLEVAVARGAAVAAMVLGLALLALVALLVMAPPVDALEDIAVAHVVGATAALASLALLHTAIAFGAGCLLGRRAQAQAIAGAVAVAGYVIQGLAASAPAVEFLRFVSPWHWYLDRNLLVQAPSLQSTLVPLALGTALAAAGVTAFLRRDLRIP